MGISCAQPEDYDQFCLSSRDFDRLARFVSQYSGIKMPPTKKSMLEGRLRRHVNSLGYADFDSYCHFLFEEGGLEAEEIALIDAVTTNKTEFFREPEHFSFLARVALPDILKRRGRIDRPVKIWSAGCSTGAEPYTVAMVLSESARDRRGLRTSILATDLCSKALRQAVLAIYPAEMAEPVPPEIRRRYLLRSKDRARAQVRIAPELRRLVRFGRLNLMAERYPVDQDMDAIFCRNLLIYFEKPKQRAVLERLCGHLVPGGYLFLGHSESVVGLDLPLKLVASTTFVRL